MQLSNTQLAANFRQRRLRAAAQNFIFARKFPEMVGVFPGTHFPFWNEISNKKKNFREAKIYGGGGCSLPLPSHTDDAAGPCGRVSIALAKS